MTRLWRWLGSSLRGDAHRMAWAAGIGVAAFALYLSNGRLPGVGDTLPARYLPHTLLHEGDADFDEFTHLFADGQPRCFLRWEGSYYSVFPPMAGFLAVPVHAAAHLLPSPDGPRSLAAQEKVAAALIAALSVAVVYLAARAAGGGPVALWVAAVYGLGTSTFSVSSQALWQHGPVQLFLAAAALALLRGRRTGRLWPAGAALAVATLCRPTAAAAAVAVGVYVLASRWRQFPAYVLAAVPFAALMAWHNAAVYGHVLGAYYRVYQGADASLRTPGGLPAGTGWWAGSVLPNLVGLLVSPSRGLLVYSPVLVLAAYGLWRKVAVERDGLFAAMAASCALQLAIVAKHTKWWGGYSFGPRYCSDLLPFAVLFLIPAGRLALERRRALATAALAALTALSIAAHACGVYSFEPHLWNVNPSVDAYPARLWQWRDSQLAAAFRSRPDYVMPDALSPAAGARARDPAAPFGWCTRIGPTGSRAVLTFERRLKTGKDCVARLRARVRGAGPAGELRGESADGAVLARVPLTPSGGGGYEEFVLRFPLEGSERRPAFRFVLVVAPGAAVDLSDVAVRRVRR